MEYKIRYNTRTEGEHNVQDQQTEVQVKVTLYATFWTYLTSRRYF